MNIYIYMYIYICISVIQKLLNLVPDGAFPLGQLNLHFTLWCRNKGRGKRRDIACVEQPTCARRW